MSACMSRARKGAAWLGIGCVSTFAAALASMPFHDPAGKRIAWLVAAIAVAVLGGLLVSSVYGREGE